MPFSLTNVSVCKMKLGIKEVSLCVSGKFSNMTIIIKRLVLWVILMDSSTVTGFGTQGFWVRTSPGKFTE